jgi:hypothetical protein
MPLRSLLLGAAAAAAFAAPASAAITVSVVGFGDPNLLPAGQVLVADFNNPGTPDATLLAGYDLDLLGATVGVDEGTPGYSGTLPNDPTNYLTVPSGTQAILTSLIGMNAFSLYMGSPDTYNSIRFIGDGFDTTLAGGQLSGGNTSQSWDYGARVNFAFNGAKVHQIILTSSGNSFESDNFAVSPAPEPATWAMMILGFGMSGALLRRRQLALG